MGGTQTESDLSSNQEDEWGAHVENAVAGDRRAYAKLVRLVTGYLIHWRAYDFSADWDDIIQEVILAVVHAHSAGKLDPPGAVKAYARQATRFKFIDKIRGNKFRASGVDLQEADERGEIAWPPGLAARENSIETRLSVWQAVEALPERERLAVVEVHARGRTYEEAAEATGIPLGSLKRALRTGLIALREHLEEGVSEAPPGGGP